ncbi:MAG: EAL domain-containing protein [Fusobacterium sp. JB021]|nr:EAL domain-containing protein [Fusobacterium sp. JB021]
MIIKKYFLSFLICFTFLINFNNTFSQKNIVKVGVFDNPVLHNNKTNGYLDEYYKLIEKYTDLEIEYVYDDWDSLTEKLKSKEIDLLGFVTFTEERANYFDYSFFNIGRISSMISTYKDNNVTPDKGFSILKNKKIGCVKSTINETKIKKILKENNISSQIIFFKNKRAMFRALKNKYLDFVIDDNIRPIYDFEKILFNFSFEKTYFVTKKGNTTLLNKVNYALNKIFTENQNKIKKLEFKLNKEEETFLKNLPILNVGFIPNNGYLSRKNGTHIKGIDVDILNIISKKLNLKINKIPVASIEEAKELMKQGKLDIMGGVSYENHFNKSFYFSVPYYNSRYYIIKNKNISNSNKFSAAFSENSKPVLYNVLNDYNFENISNYSYINTLLKNINKNNNNFTVLESDVADYYLRNNTYKNLIIDLAPYRHLKSLAISKKLPFYFSTIINKTICNLDENTIHEIVLKNKIYDDNFSLFNKINISKTQLLIFYELILALFFIIILLFYFRYKSIINFKNLKTFDEITESYNFYEFEKKVQPILKNISTQQYFLISLEVSNLDYICEIYGFKYKNIILKVINDTIQTNLGSSEYFCRTDLKSFIGFGKFNNTKLLKERFTVVESKINKEIKNKLNKDIDIIFKNGIFIINETISLEKAISNCYYTKKFNPEYFSSITYFYKDNYKKLNLFNEKIIYSAKKAFLNKEFKIYYQPKINLETNSIIGAEVSILWKNSDFGIVPKEIFYPIFIKNGFINELNLYIMEDVCKKLEFLNIKDIKDISISFDFPINFFENEYTHSYLEILNKYNFKRSLMKIELSNIKLESDLKSLIEKIDRIKSLGFNIYLDLFKNEFLSIKNIDKLNLNYLKFNKSFLDNLEKNDLEKEIIKSIISFSNINKIPIIYTGINNEEKLNYVKNLNCKYVQGNFFYPPLKFEEFYKLIRK